jgi:hypothetical protein
MDAIPLGIGLIHAIPCTSPTKVARIGMINSNDNANKLAMNRFLAAREFHEIAIATIAAMNTIEPIQSMVSEISENKDDVSDGPSTLFR